MTENFPQPNFETKALSWNEFTTAIMDLLDNLPQTIFESENSLNKFQYTRTFKLLAKDGINTRQIVYLLLDSSNQKIYFGFKKVSDAYLSNPLEEYIINQEHFDISFEDLNSISILKNTMKEKVNLDFFDKKTEINC